MHVQMLKGGTVTFPWQIEDDTDTAQADIDRGPLVVDGAGKLLAPADDYAYCTYPPVCGLLPCSSSTVLLVAATAATTNDRNDGNDGSDGKAEPHSARGLW